MKTIMHEKKFALAALLRLIYYDNSCWIKQHGRNVFCNLMNRCHNF